MRSLGLCAVSLLLAACCWQQVLARDLLRAPRHKRDGLYLCGSQLVEVLSMVCGPAGISGASGKRTVSDPWEDYDVYSFNHLSDVEGVLKYVPYSRQQLLQSLDPLSGQHRRQRNAEPAGGDADRVRAKRQGGIVQQCCLNPCTVLDLKSYCN